jgi:hypothetical protein
MQEILDLLSLALIVLFIWTKSKCGDHVANYGKGFLLPTGMGRLEG